LLDRGEKAPKANILTCPTENQAGELHDRARDRASADQGNAQGWHLPSPEAAKTERLFQMQEQVERVKSILLADLGQKSEIRKKYNGRESQKKYQMMLELRDLQRQTDARLSAVMSQVQMDAYHKLLEQINGKVGGGGLAANGISTGAGYSERNI